MSESAAHSLLNACRNAADLTLTVEPPAQLRNHKLSWQYTYVLLQSSAAAAAAAAGLLQVLPNKGAGPRALYAALGGKLPSQPAAAAAAAPPMP
jgi:hypothetical protein